ncbi:BTAD domain-containing putative transcriptional regulator [Streptomyces cyanogenus]|uniref:HTH-type transcriptional regulator n=1 Tax=Streptomyces cyanogenus TaxID=80860 RepID=A0ABX7TZL6_STRCY|nr:BTAD domain-containing putative transcriptional regulator [Streptomyces cyanogenus]QTE01144.1 Putative HTH-type transcriptional regulator [Streptomyces cyanogenus]
MRFGILGPTEIHTDDGTPVDPGGPRPRALLTLLLLDAGRPVSVERLLDGLYGAEPPAGALGALQSQISRLRRRLAPHTRIDAVPAGYALAVDPDTVDAHRFARLAAEGRSALTAGDHPRAVALLRDALALWRGPALPDLPDAHADRARLDELRPAAVQDRIEAELGTGGGPELVPELRALLRARPLDERLYGQLMRALHAAGRPAEALAVFEEARRTLAGELGADPSPELSALHLGLLRDGSGAPARPRLPAQLTRFVGREAELARVDRALAGSRLVTLTGPGGVGKTRLALEAARARTGADVCLVELAPLADGARIPFAVLAALGVRDGFRSPATDALERLLAALADREVLLVLDNCEHLVEPAARTAALLLGACPGVRLLVTSRESLGVTGEVLVPVPPLPEEPAVRLLLDRARAVRPDFDGHARVPEICRALDGLPLAIELAAARLRTLSVDELADRLHDRFRVLARGDRAKAPRHRTLRAVVEWSWELLDAGERDLASRLTVFAGGATLDAVAAVCGVPYPEEPLASLVEKSFLEVSDGRYRMLETIRAFAAESLAEGRRPGTGGPQPPIAPRQLHAEPLTDSPQPTTVTPKPPTTPRPPHAKPLTDSPQPSTRDPKPPTALRPLHAAHAAYFLRLAEEAEPLLRGGDQVRWLRRLAAEQGNLDAALRYLTETAPRDALRLTAALTWFRRLRGLHGDRVPGARALLAAVGTQPPPGLAEEYALCVMNAVSGRGDDPEDPGLTARAATLMGCLDGPLRLPFTVILWSLTGGPQLSVDERVRGQLGREPWGLALLDVGLAYQALFAGRAVEAEAGFTRAWEGFRGTGDRWGMANCLDPLGGFAYGRGAYARALALLDEGLVHVRELDAPEETADLLRTRAAVLLAQGASQEAAAHFTRSAELARTAGASDKVAGALRGLGDTARLAGDTARARVHYENALEACAATWFSVGETARILVGLGRTAAAEGDRDTARDWLAQARAQALESGDAVLLADVADALAALAPRPERAAELLGAAAGLRGAPRPGDPDVARTTEHTRACLSPEAYATAHERGRGLRWAAVSER